MIDRKWGQMILNGEKSIEVRHFKNQQHCGKRVGLCFNGTSRVYGYVTFINNIKFCPRSWRRSRDSTESRKTRCPMGGRRGDGCVQIRSGWARHS